MPSSDQLDQLAREQKHITVKVSYFALLKEQAQKDVETLTLTGDISTRHCEALWLHLCDRYPFTLKASQMRVAINDAFSNWDTPLNDGDHVVFIPPVAGG